MSSAAIAPRAVSGRTWTLRIARVLFHREMHWPFAIILLAVIAASVFFGRHAVTGASEGATPVPRFPALVLASVIVLACVRIASRFESDAASGWIAPLFTAGATRAGYASSLAGSVLVASALLHAAAICAFAAGTIVFGDTYEMLRLLPRTVGAGTLLLVVIGTWCAVLSLVVRNAISTVLLLVVVLVTPWALVVRYVASGSEVPRWLELLARTMPPITPPVGVSAYAAAIVHLVIAAALLLAIATRTAGRRP